MEYQKINTLFLRDEKKVIIPSSFTCDEFEYLKDCKWECTEKIDGCLWWGTRIKMADGTIKLIKDIQEGDIVLGYDTENNTGVQQVKVQKVTKRSAAGTWVKLKVTHNNLDKGNSFGNVICTFDHKIWTPDRGYIEAYKLKSGDKVLSVRRDTLLNPIQEQVLIGKMLGDGSFASNNQKTASITFGHSNHEMTKWTLQALQELAGEIHTRTSGYESEILVGRTKNSRQIYDLFKSWFYTEDKTKQVPSTIKLTPISLAFWYMDDGTLCHCEGQEDRVRFATNAFTEESCNNLLNALSIFGIEGTIKDYKGNTICLDAENAEKLFLLIFPYICKSYQYKLPERYRDCTPYLPKSKDTQYHRELVEQTVLEVTKEDKSYERWDLTTETHNFFTTTCLVHNTNIRIYISREYDGEDDWLYGVSFMGRTNNSTIPEHLNLKLQQIFYRVDWKTVFPSLMPGDSVCLYGEGYGNNIQKGSSYISNDVDFILFDVRYNNWWLERKNCEDIANKCGIKIVPIVGYMTIPEAIDLVKKGFKSSISEDKNLIAEGLVLKTPQGLLSRDGKRIITKIKHNDFVKFKNVYGQDF